MRLWGVVGLVALMGCAKSLPPPIPMDLPPTPPPAPIVEPLALPTDPEVLSDGDHDPLRVIDRANTAALIVPTRRDFSRSLWQPLYREHALYRVDMVASEGIDIMLQPEERLLIVSPGDERFEFKVSEGIDPIHIVIRPTRPKLKTRILLVTTLGTYQLVARSRDTVGLAAMSWRHPPKRKVRPEASVVYGVGYGVQSGQGQAWQPIYAWDNEKQTMLLFDERMRHTQAPIVSVGQPEGTPLVVNYRVHGRLFIVDRLLDHGESLELRVNSAEAGVIRVVKTDEYRLVRCPGDEVCGLIGSWQGSRHGAAERVFR